MNSSYTIWANYKMKTKNINLRVILRLIFITFFCRCGCYWCHFSGNSDSMRNTQIYCMWGSFYLFTLEKIKGLLMGLLPYSHRLQKKKSFGFFSGYHLKIIIIFFFVSIVKKSNTGTTIVNQHVNEIYTLLQRVCLCVYGVKYSFFPLFFFENEKLNNNERRERKFPGIYLKLKRQFHFCSELQKTHTKNATERTYKQTKMKYTYLYV